MTGQSQDRTPKLAASKCFVSPLGQTQTFAVHKGMSAKCQKRAFIGAELAGAVAVIYQKGVGIHAR